VLLWGLLLSVSQLPKEYGGIQIAQRWEHYGDSGGPHAHRCVAQVLPQLLVPAVCFSCSSCNV
jgi:hypothetical protein